MGTLALLLLLALSPPALSENLDISTIYRIRHHKVFQVPDHLTASAEFHLRTNALGKLPKLDTTSYPDPIMSSPQLRCDPVDTNCRWEKHGNWTIKRVNTEDIAPSFTHYDICKRNNGGCQIYCRSSGLKPHCSCPTGYILNSDQKTCRGSGIYNHILTNNAGSFSTPNYPNNYDNNLDVRWLLVVPENMTIRLDIDSLSVEADNDYMIVYDGADTSARAIAKYSTSHYGNPLWSSGNTMLVTFHSSPSSTNRGFLVHYRTELPHVINNEGCQVASQKSGSSTVCSCPSGYALNSDKKTCRPSESYRYMLTSTSGKFSSPNYPSSYNNGQFLKWLLVAPQHHKITLKIESFQTERGYDRLEMHDGPDTSARKIASYTGTFYSTVTNSTGNTMCVTFVSDGSNTYQGFQISYSTEPVKLTSPSLFIYHGSLRSLSFVPEDTRLCVSVVYKLEAASTIWVTANLAHGSSLNLTAVTVGGAGGWQTGRFKGTLKPEQMTHDLRLSIHFSGSHNFVFSIMGCNPYDEEDIFLMDDSVPLELIPEVTITPDPYTGPPRRCYNGGIFLNETEECICPTGFRGHDCQEACGPNSFGQDCGGMCSGFEEGCLKMIFCQPYLPCMCAPGFTGKHCDQQCREGYYGASCRIPCGSCSEDYCNIYTGECKFGCKQGYYPPLCQDKYITLSKAPDILSKDSNSAAVDARLSSVIGQGSVKFFQVQYKERGSGSWLELPPQEPVLQKFSARIQNLKAGTHHLARIILIADDGNSNQETDVPVVEFQTLCTVPTSKDYHLRTERVTSSTVEVSWKYEVLNSEECPLTGLEITFIDRWRMLKHNVTAQTTAFTFHKLLPGMTYTVKVKALTEFGPAPKSSALSFTTLHEAPGEVTDLKVSVRAPGEVLVSWNKPRFNNGTISHYRVQYECLRLLACSLSCNSSNGQVEALTQSVILTGLHPHAQYRIKVSGFTASLGPYKSIVTATQHTGASVAPGASPTPITHRFNTSVGIQWTPPTTCSGLNGFLYGYRYELLSKSAGDHILLTGSTHDTHINFTGLTPHTSYEARIFLVTSGGSGGSHKLVIPITTSATAPEQVQNLTVYKKGRRMIGVRWAAPLQSYGPIKSFKVTHQRKDTLPGTEVKEEIRPVHCTAWPDLYCHTINNVIPNSQYVVSVQAQNMEVDSDGAPSTVTAVTQELAPGAPTNLRVMNRTQNSMVVEWGLPFMVNGVLRSFLVNVEEIDTSNPSTCCDYFPIQELPVRTEEQLYRLEVDGLNPASTVTISVSAKTVTMGPSINTTARTFPEPPARVYPPRLHSRAADSDLFNVSIVPTETYPGLQSTYLLMILPSEARTDPIFWDEELLIQLKEAVNSSFYAVTEFSHETLVGEEEVIIGTGAPQTNGSLGVLEDPVLSPGSYRAGLALILDYFGSKSVGFAKSDIFVVP